MFDFLQIRGFVGLAPEMRLQVPCIGVVLKKDIARGSGDVVAGLVQGQHLVPLDLENGVTQCGVSAVG